MINSWIDEVWIMVRNSFFDDAVVSERAASFYPGCSILSVTYKGRHCNWVIPAGGDKWLSLPIGDPSDVSVCNESMPLMINIDTAMDYLSFFVEAINSHCGERAFTIVPGTWFVRPGGDGAFLCSGEMIYKGGPMVCEAEIEVSADGDVKMTAEENTRLVA